MADLIIDKIFEKPVFTWGARSDLSKAGDTRSDYLKAVKAADLGNIEPLLEFARK
jgi:hypothetical protein